jgi:hypothetical protein
MDLKFSKIIALKKIVKMRAKKRLAQKNKKKQVI